MAEGCGTAVVVVAVEVAPAAADVVARWRDLSGNQEATVATDPATVPNSDRPYSVADRPAAVASLRTGIGPTFADVVWPSRVALHWPFRLRLAG